MTKLYFLDILYSVSSLKSRVLGNRTNRSRKEVAMACASPKRAGVPLVPDLPLLNRGKVSDVYALGDGMLLKVATDAGSVFDFSLNALFPQKGIVLNALNHFWAVFFQRLGVQTHLVAAGHAIDKYLPKRARGDFDLQSRAMVVRKLEMVPVEFVARMALTGSGLKEYLRTAQGTVCGCRLPGGLQDGDALPYCLATPTSKEETGHDQALQSLEIMRMYPFQTHILEMILQTASWYAEQRGIKIIDTKLEFGNDGTVGDEILTPDSSRFSDYRAWLASRAFATRKMPPSLDKQFVRAWAIEKGIDKRDPADTKDVAWVHSLQVPDGTISNTTQIYRYIFWRLTGRTLESYLRDLNVAVPVKNRKRVLIICGSQSDVPTVKRGLALAKERPLSLEHKVHVMSCHRNPERVRDYLRCEVQPHSVDAIVAVGGMAFALPGMIDAFLADMEKPIPVVGVALGELGSKDLLAAQLSISRVPGSPLVIDEVESGEPYSHSDGLAKALIRISDGELPPPPVRSKKPVEMNVDVT